MEVATSPAMQRALSQGELFRSAANLINKDEYGTLILDSRGGSFQLRQAGGSLDQCLLLRKSGHEWQ